MPLTLIRFWLGPLPLQEIFPEKRPNFLLHWLAHPLKRRLAKYYLWFLQRFTELKVIAVTGSVGKTTTKNLLASLLSQRGHTVTTTDNTTSTYNIPTTILSTPPRTKFLILEMSVEYPGDMDFYTWLARPNVAILLNVAPVHTIYLKTLDDLAAEKSKIFTRLPPAGSAVINADDPRITPPINAKTYTFGAHPDAFCQIISARLTSDLTTEIKLITNQQPQSFNLKLIGKHYASNLAAAVCATSALGIACPLSLPISPTPHRLQPFSLKNGNLLIDDAHNANPLAVAHSLSTLTELARLTHLTPIFVFAQMNELGHLEKTAHQDIGLLLKKLRLKNLFCLGPATKHTLTAAGFGRHFDTLESLYQAYQRFTTDKSKNSSHFITLIKGSRSWHLERLVTSLTAKTPAQTGIPHLPPDR